MTKENKNLHDDFVDFLSAPEIEPSRNIRENVLARISAELNPSRKHIFF